MNAGKAGRSQEALCDEFLARHSEYVDGRLSPMAAARLRSHAGACASCARYDRIVRRGIDLVRDLPDVQPSEEFDLRLQHRIFHVQDAEALGRPRAASAAAALGVAAAIALLAWSPILVTNTLPTASVAAETAAASEFAASATPLFDESAWYPVSLPAAPAPSSTASLAMFPGPYSPLIVTPPAHRSVRAVSTGSAPTN